MRDIDWYAIVDSVGTDADVEQFVTMPAASRLLLMELATSFYGRYNRSGLAEPSEMYKYLSTAQKALAREEQPMDKKAIALGTAINIIQMMPGIVGLWPMSATNALQQSNDLSGNNLHLTNNGVVPVSFSEDGAFFQSAYSNSLSFNDNAIFDIRGNEQHITDKGLTIGCWVKPVSFTNYGNIMGKFSSGQRSYSIRMETNNNVSIVVSPDGTTQYLSTSSGSLLLTDEWHLVIGRYKPAQLSVFLDGAFFNQASSPTLLFNGSAKFAIGAYGDGSLPINGRVLLSFLASSWVSDAFIQTIYSVTRGLFNG